MQNEKTQIIGLRFAMRRVLQAVSVIVSLGVAGVQADEHLGSATGLDEEALVERIKEQIIKELKDEEFLQKQIEIGIQNFILKQREAQAEQRRAAQERVKNVRRASLPRDHIRGNPQAEVSLIEYSDFECPFCKRFHPTAAKVVELYKGRVNWVYRHFPLTFHNPGAQKQAEASECAGDLGGHEAFWKYTDAIYERTRSNGRGFPIKNLVPLAVELGLDEQKFASCLESEKFAERVQSDFTEGSQIGITGTPGNVLINNKTGKAKLIAGAVPLASLRAEIDQLLKSN